MSDVATARGLRRDLRRSRGLFRRSARVEPLAGIDLDVAAGELLAVVGESGSGKSVLGRVLAGLDRPTAGTLRVTGRAALVTPDTEPGRPSAAALKLVGLDPAAARRPAGDVALGDRRRLALAAALAGDPSLVVLDEPVGDLDVSAAAQLTNLLDDLRGHGGAAFVVLTRDLPLALHLADRVAVLYRGHLVEVADPAELRAHPLHPYSQVLAAAAPMLEPGRAREPLALLGEEGAAVPSGCPLRTRCFRERELCAEPPRLAQGPGVTGHLVACHLPTL